jgi:hypothetical protein
MSDRRDQGPPPAGDLLRQLEPAARTVDGVDRAIGASVAISLKRIADELEIARAGLRRLEDALLRLSQRL